MNTFKCSYSITFYLHFFNCNFYFVFFLKVFSKISNLIVSIFHWKSIAMICVCCKKKYFIPIISFRFDLFFIWNSKISACPIYTEQQKLHLTFFHKQYFLSHFYALIEMHGIVVRWADRGHSISIWSEIFISS